MCDKMEWINLHSGNHVCSIKMMGEFDKIRCESDPDPHVSDEKKRCSGLNKEI